MFVTPHRYPPTRACFTVRLLCFSMDMTGHFDKAMTALGHRPLDRRLAPFHAWVRSAGWVPSG